MTNVDQQVATAWGQLRADRNNDAIKEMENVLKTAPNDVDALYGMGLALRKLGRKDEALAMFEKALKFAKELSTSNIEGQEAAGDKLQIQGQNTRYLMLTRMLQQRAAETKAM